MPLLDARDVIFLKLQPAVLCIECELISYNNTDRCLACGSRAVMSLSRVLGGSLLGDTTTKIIPDEELHRVVADVLAGSGVEERPATCVPIGNPALRSAMCAVVEEAQIRTGADGAALALNVNGRILCTTHLGTRAPDIGAEVRLDTGITGYAMRTGRTLRCDDLPHSPYVDHHSCRELGVRSLVVAPLTQVNSVIGVLEVLASEQYAFDDHHVATVQLLASLMVLALTQKSLSGGYGTLQSRRPARALPTHCA